MNNINPWIGLNSYQEGQVLYGRSREIQDLSLSVFYNRQTVVYGKSGIGKSSLLHAGIFPMARLRGCLPISVRFDHASKISYRQQLIQRITEAVLAAGGAMADTQTYADAPKSLWEFFHRMQPQKDGQIITPLIVIDQFEEIFTLSKNTQTIRAFFDELADLFNNVMPEYLNSDSASYKTKGTGSIFDGLSVSSANRFEQEMSYHMVFVLREDYLSFLERYATHIPALKQNRYGLLPITYRQAMEIITKPCEGLVGVEVADAIIRHITVEQDINDETPVDSAILSLYLSRLFEKKKDAPTISMQLVKEQGDALIEDFYAEVVASIDRKTIEYLEDVLINADGHRENVTLESLYKKAGIDSSVIETLERAHSLRIFSYGNVQRVEFAHDVLCPIIVRRRSQRQNVARMRRVLRIGFYGFFILWFIIFGGLILIGERLEKKDALEKQQSRLSEMEYSLIEKGAYNMLKEQDIYGAIQLLLNSMNIEQTPSRTTACFEKVLRQAIDSLAYSNTYCVAKIRYKAFFLDKVIASPSGKLIAMSDRTNRCIVIDSYTGSIVQQYSLCSADSFSLERNVMKEKVGVTKGKIVYERRVSNINPDKKMKVEDVHPDDSRCLLRVDNTLYDCYIRHTGDMEANGKTRLCLHDFPKTINEAKYNEDGNQIIIKYIDNTHSIYDANTGYTLQCEDSCSILKKYFAEAEQRNMYHDLRRYHSRARSKIRLRTFDYWNTFCIQGDTTDNVIPKISAISNDCIHFPSQEMENKLRARLDSLDELPSALLAYTNSYQFENDSITIPYYWPLAINPQGNRMVLLKPVEIEDAYWELYGIYPHNGSVFFQKTLPYCVHSLHFTKDDQYIVVNYGEDTQEVIYLPPLEQLVNTCKNMFFDWQMTEEERYQTYIHMND